MSADKHNTFVIFRSAVLRSGAHPLRTPLPSIHGIQVALRPGCPPDYLPPLPRGTIVWAASDGSSAIDSSSGYYTVRPYAEVHMNRCLCMFAFVPVLNEMRRTAEVDLVHTRPIHTLWPIQFHIAYLFGQSRIAEMRSGQTKSK